MRVFGLFLIAVLTLFSQVYAQQEFFPIAKGTKWEYRVTFPANVRLPYFPVVEYPDGLIGATFFSGMGSWTAGQTNFEVLVGDIAEKTATSTSWKLASNLPLLKFLFFQTDTVLYTCQLRLRNDGTAMDLSVVAFMNLVVPPWRLAKFVSRLSAGDLVKRYPVSVPAGQYTGCAVCTMILNGDGQFVPVGTYPVEAYLAPGVGIVKAVGKDPAGVTQYTLELTKFTGAAAVSVEADHAAPTECSLLQNYPNPFNPSTKIEFDIPHTSFVTLKVYNALGVELATLVSSELSGGRYGAVWNAGGASSGIYFCRMQAGTYTRTQKMVLVR